MTRRPAALRQSEGNEEDATVLDVWNRERNPLDGDAEPEERARDDRAPAGHAGNGAPARGDEPDLELPDPGQYVTYPGEGR
jgi:hypothetical protein